MKGNWSKLFIKITGWLLVELLLNAVGLDTLADYSEYLFTTKETIEKRAEERTPIQTDEFPIYHPILSLS